MNAQVQEKQDHQEESRDVAEVSPIERFRAQVYGDRLVSELEAALPEHITVKKFQQILITAVNKNPDLLDADRPSLFSSCVECAHDGLVPNGKEAALVIYSTKVKVNGQEVWIKKVQYMPMIAGLYKRARASGEVTFLAAHVVYKNDTFEYEYGFDPKVLHRPALDNRGDVRGVYAAIKLKDGDPDLEYMPLEDVEKVRKASKYPDKGPWRDWWDEMARKTVVRRLAKRIQLSPEIERIIQRMDAMYDFESSRAQTIDGAYSQVPTNAPPRPSAALPPADEPMPGKNDLFPLVDFTGDDIGEFHGDAWIGNWLTSFHNAGTDENRRQFVDNNRDAWDDVRAAGFQTDDVAVAANGLKTSGKIAAATAGEPAVPFDEAMDPEDLAKSIANRVRACQSAEDLDAVRAANLTSMQWLQENAPGQHDLVISVMDNKARGLSQETNQDAPA